MDQETMEKLQGRYNPSTNDWEQLEKWREALPADDLSDFDSLDDMTKRHMVCGLYDEFKAGQARRPPNETQNATGSDT